MLLVRKQKSTMRHFLRLLALALVALLAACASTPSSRIAKNRAEFEQYPPAIRVKIIEGKVDVGFTPAMVRLAFGEPARVFTRQAESGNTEVWVYHHHSPQFSVGLGFGSYGRHSASSVGVSTSTGGYDAEEKMRVEFREGKVAAIEYARG